MRKYRKQIAASALSGAVAISFACASGFAQESTPAETATTPAATESAPAAAATPAPESQSAPSDSATLGQSIETQIQEAFEKCKGAVVRIEASRGVAVQAGSGFFIDPAGTVCTHFFVVAGGESFSVLMGDKKLEAKLLVADPRSGVALLKVKDVATSFLSPANFSEVKVASPILVVGYCKDLPLAPALGLVSGFDKEYLGRNLGTMHIRASIPAEPGQGGAPVVNFKGEVVGIMAIQLPGGRSSYVLPMQAAVKVQGDYIKYGRRKDGWVGLDVDFFDPLTLQAPRISRIVSESPAGESGIQVGDELLKLGEYPIESRGDLANASFYLTADEPVKMVVRRNGEEIEIEVKPKLHPLVPNDAAIAPGLPMSSNPTASPSPAPQ